MSPILSGVWSPQEKPVQVNAKRTWTREGPLHSLAHSLHSSTTIPSAAFRGECWGRQDPHAPWMVFPRLSFCQAQKRALLITEWSVPQEHALKTPANPGAAAHTESRAAHEKVAACFALQCLLLRIRTAAALKNWVLQPRNQGSDKVFTDKGCSDCVKRKSLPLFFNR